MANLLNTRKLKINLNAGDDRELKRVREVYIEEFTILWRGLETP